MGNSSSSNSKETKEALLNFDSGEVDALKQNYHRLAASTAPKGLITTQALSTELHISNWLASNLLRTLRDAANPTIGPTKKAPGVVGFERFVVSLAQCCSSSRSERREFALAVLCAGGSSVSREDIRQLLLDFTNTTLPQDAAQRPALLNDVVTYAVDSAFEGVRSKQKHPRRPSLASPLLHRPPQTGSGLY
jgi:hypothetical protein